jgi:xylulose-5-phosphate/fructose-6-phosphate phosphoketolase
MTVLNEMDRFHLVIDALQRLPQLRDISSYLKEEMAEQLIRHKLYIREHGIDMPEVINWKWEAN